MELEIELTPELKEYLYDLGLLLEDEMVERLICVKLSPAGWSVYVAVFGEERASLYQRWCEWGQNGEYSVINTLI